VKAKKGTWSAEVELHDEGSWGMRVAVLSAHHVDHANDVPTVPSGFEVGVDSGQAGIFDKKVFRADRSVPKGYKRKYHDVICEDEKWYSYICDNTLAEPGAAVVNGGVVSSSGYGDGGYECLLAEDKKKQVVAIKITFIPEPVTCDECGATYDPDEISASGICDSCQEELDREEDDPEEDA